MRLAELTHNLPGTWVEGDGDVCVSGLTHDSRAVEPGSLFVALPGRNFDGSRFIPQAIHAGAVAVALPQNVPAPPSVPVVRMENPRPDLARLAARFFGEPAQRLDVIGITGTNGKTTTSTLLAEVCRTAGRKEGLIGTIVHRIAGVERPARFTTPEAPQLHEIFSEMEGLGVEVVAMEVSSVGLCEHRVDGIPFMAAAFLNLSPDHLDYHGDMSSYGQAKARLFHELMAPGATAVINIDDEGGRQLVADLSREQCPIAVWTLSLEDEAADVRFSAIEQTTMGCMGTLETPMGQVEIRSPLLGDFNAANIACAAALARVVGIDASAITAGLSRAQVPGRLQTVENERDLTIVVDYAHSVDAIERVLATLTAIATGRVWCLFGCGGDRDRLKRAPMGEAAAAADGVVVTSDNPRSEDPAQIARAAAEGAISAGKPLAARPTVGRTYIELDRRKAIEAVLGQAVAGDVILIAGKGHETYQEVGGVRHPFDDVAVVRSIVGGGTAP